jgi:integrase/recombinase XerC
VSNFVASLRRVPRTLTDAEQTRILRVTGEHREHFRDHVIISLALGSGLRESELAALNVGDVAELSAPAASRRLVVRKRIELRVFAQKGRKKGQPRPAPQQVFLTAKNMEKLDAFLKWKATEGEKLEPGSPLFTSSRRKRISTRTLRSLFRLWQKRAGFDQLLPFHALRHTAGTNIYRATGDVRVAQRHLRHAHLGSTEIYTHVSDEDLSAAVKGLKS